MKEIKRYCAGKEEVDKFLKIAIDQQGLSARPYSGILKVGRTIANLAGSEDIEAPHIAEVIQYRSLHRII